MPSRASVRKVSHANTSSLATCAAWGPSCSRQSVRTRSTSFRSSCSRLAKLCSLKSLAVIGSVRAVEVAGHLPPRPTASRDGISTGESVRAVEERGGSRRAWAKAVVLIIFNNERTSTYAQHADDPQRRRPRVPSRRAPTTRIARWPTSSRSRRASSPTRAWPARASTRSPRPRATSKRMIYYYFGSKEGLYLAVLEEAYRRIRDIETELHLDDLRARRGAAQAGRLHLRLPAGESRFHPARDEREHPPRRVPGAEQEHPGTQRAGDRCRAQRSIERGVARRRLPQRTSIRSTCTCRSAR